MIIVLLLLMVSALVSGSEVAYYSLSPSQLDKIQEMEGKRSKRVSKLLKNPEKLLATILISNNFINVAIVIISTFITASLFNFNKEPFWAFLIQVVTVTFLLLLFAEIIPKLYANQYALKFSLFMSAPLFILGKFFTPLSTILINSTSFVNKRLRSKKSNLSMGDLSDAIDLTTGVVHEEKKILKSIVKFTNIEVNDIMKPRLDIVAVDINEKLSALIEIINESGHSRIPVYSETFDNVKGTLYVKDLLPYIEEKNDFKWQSLVRPSYFVPGAKKINVLLQEFREKKIHFAIVVDEYGGTEGIVTLEDILEEIVGEITDESDEIEELYTKIDDKNYIFDAKVLLNDFYKTLMIQEDIFEKERGDSDTIGGLILEVTGDIPSLNDVVKIGNFSFTITSVDKRKINKLRLSIN
ncbi:MAG: gliding motility-associated protein GldE [Bacteroidales bacterium]|nr:gliding motility-associated protein GldE [Bacteroidales bacterium]